MKRLLAIAIAVTAITMISNEVQAQPLRSGFRFGVGLGSARTFGINNFQNRRFNNLAFGFNRVFVHQRVEEPPYFAKFPPVYYNDIVARNYGVSPYAVPGGIMPVEGVVPVESSGPVRIQNQFYPNQGVAPSQPSPGDDKDKKSDEKKGDGKSDKAKAKKAPWDKSAQLIVNPYVTPRVAKQK